jgi:hypothetical protein
MVLFALMLPGIVALMGLVVDMGRLLAERRQLQAAADAAAWAAATEVLWGSPGNAGAVAQWYAQQNGYGPTSNATVTVSQPPTSGAYVGQSDYLQVTVRRPVTLTLAQIVHPDPITIEVTATAGPSLGPAPYGLLALNSASGGIDLSGAVIVRNSSAASNYQIRATGSGSLTADVLATAHSGMTASGGGLVAGAKGTVPDAAVIPDPFKNLPEPPVPTTTWSGLSVTGSGTLVTAQPGHWTGDLRVRGSNNQVTLSPGVYYFDGGATIDISGTGNRVVGSGVLIFLKDSSTLSLAGGADLQLSAPSAAPYSGGAGGLVVYGARGTTSLIDLNGGAAPALTGTVYAPDAPIRLTGGAAAGIGQGQVIADRFTIGGISTLILNYDRNVVARQKRPALVE